MPDQNDVLADTLADTWKLFEKGVLNETDLRDLIFTNLYNFYTTANPDFFKGTVIERKLAESKVAELGR